MSREDLINQLAVSMGATGHMTSTYESRYDPDTGTLYCNGHMISKNTIDEAERFFLQMQNKCDVTFPESRQMAQIYQVALEGIKQIRKMKSDK
ncbi:MAG: hypothetical protein K6G10_01595 [Butyrivibrio sp.]|nr:hypothetical protein [Butyrivibrio sp.]